jgi:D-allose transport system ATP-binding protein
MRLYLFLIGPHTKKGVSLMDSIIEMINIRKEFPGVVALDNITFDLKPGEVHLLLGENGAGKSTLMKILSGVYTPTKGLIVINGKKFSKLTPKESADNKISVIFQELSLINELSIAENLFVGKIPVKKFLGFPVVDTKYMNKKTKEMLEKVGLERYPSTKVENLSISEKQLVEIAKALVADSKILIMDEPTSSLTEEEANNLFRIIKDLKSSGVGIIYISHKLRETKIIGDRVTILKDGVSVTTKNMEDIKSEEEIVSLMVGRELKNKYFHTQRKSQSTDKVIFKALNITRKDEKVKNVSFELRENEVLGFAGLVGAGRTELMNAIFGSEKKISGEIYLHGKKVNTKSPYHSLKNEIGMITENRRETGLLPNFEIRHNLALVKRLKDSRLEGIIGLIKKKAELELAEEQRKKLQLKCSSVKQMITELSGGNQQKVIIGKWLAASASLMIFDEPTKGIDVGAKSEIYSLIRKLADEGKGIIMVSSELPELLTVCDRIIVFGKGEIKAILPIEEATEEKILKAATM